MNAVEQTFLGYMAAHWEAFTAAGTVLGIALVSCLPPTRPKTIDDWYDYVRHALQTAIPAARAATPSQVHIQTTQQGPGTSLTQDATYTAAASPPHQPEGPAQPK